MNHQSNVMRLDKEHEKEFFLGKKANQQKSYYTYIHIMIVILYSCAFKEYCNKICIFNRVKWKTECNAGKVPMKALTVQWFESSCISRLRGPLNWSVPRMDIIYIQFKWFITIYVNGGQNSNTNKQGKRWHFPFCKL